MKREKERKADIRNGKGNKSIKGKLLKTSLTIIILFLSILGIVSSVINYSSTVDSLEETMTESAVLAAQSITHDLETYKVLANEVSSSPAFMSDAAVKETVSAECENIKKRNGLDFMDVCDVEGLSYLSGESVADQEFFKKAKETGQPFIADPMFINDDGNMYIIISAPITEGNAFKGIAFIGVNTSILSELVSGINIGETGNASIINGKGETIGYKDIQLVLDAYNTQNELKNDKELEELAAVERKVMSGETGFDTYRYGGVSKYAAYAPIEGTNGWGIYVAVAQSEFLKSTYIGIAIVIAILVAAVIFAVVFMTKFADTIAKPIKLCVDRMKELAEGDIHTEVPVITTGDETQELAESTGILVENMRKVIGDIDYCLTAMADGNFAVRSQAADNYVGDFENIISSMRKLNRTLNETIKHIIEVSEQVSLGAGQMAQSAQSLAEGATDQAGAVEELTATITDVANMAEESAQDTEHVYKDAKQSAVTAERSGEEIANLTEAMYRIRETSNEIENIIGSIEDIASQTNLLSLNASIEAARAGEAGKGFAVVADQIGKLASDSAKSAVTTRELIEKSLLEVEKGNLITEKTTLTLNEIITGMKSFAQVVSGVSEKSSAQAETMLEIEKGVSQISGVVQSNSAAAEETSATSEELSAQSDTLMELVSKFKLKDVN